MALTPYLVSMALVIAASQALAAAPVAVHDYFQYPASATDPLDVLANDSDPDGDPLVITAVSGPGFSVAPDGTSLRYDASTPRMTNDPYAIARYTVSDGASPVTAYVGVSAAKRAPLRAPGFAPATTYRLLEIDPVNNVVNEVQVHSDALSQKIRFAITARNPHETPVTSSRLALPGNGVALTVDQDDMGMDRCVSTAYSTAVPATPALEISASPAYPTIPTTGYVFLGVSNLAGRKFERWFADTGSGRLFLFGRRTSKGFLPRDVRYFADSNLSALVAYFKFTDFVSYPQGLPDQSVFAVPAICP